MTPRRPRRLRRVRGDDGVLTLLIIGCAFIVVLMVVVTTSVSAVFLARRELVSVVDGAAITAAQQVDAAELYTGDPRDRLPLSESRVRDVVALVDSQHADIAFGPTSIVDGSTVTVRAEKVVDLRLAAVLGISSWRVRASATARAPLR